MIPAMVHSPNSTAIPALQEPVATHVNVVLAIANTIVDTTVTSLLMSGQSRFKSFPHAHPAFGGWLHIEGESEFVP